jgi:hypothetical protein
MPRSSRTRAVDPTTPPHRRTAMPLALAASSPNPLATSEHTMEAALALDNVQTIPTLTLVQNAPVYANAAPSQLAPRPLAMPEEVTLLRASQVENVAAEEIEFFFACDADDDASVRARATITTWIAELPARDQEALALYFEPEPWPESILEEGLDYTSGYALVLSRAATKWRRNGRRSYPAEQTSNEQLRAAVFVHGPRTLRHLTRRAEWDFATALRAYAKARGRAPSVVGCERRASSASEGS